MEFLTIIERADDGSFSVYVPDLPDAEAIRGHLNMMRESGEPVPSPRSQARIVRTA